MAVDHGGNAAKNLGSNIMKRPPSSSMILRMRSSGLRLKSIGSVEALELAFYASITLSIIAHQLPTSTRDACSL
jgi:hypothetical protein